MHVSRAVACYQGCRMLAELSHVSRAGADFLPPPCPLLVTARMWRPLTPPVAVAALPRGDSLRARMWPQLTPPVDVAAMPRGDSLRARMWRQLTPPVDVARCPWVTHWSHCVHACGSSSSHQSTWQRCPGVTHCVHACGYSSSHQSMWHVAQGLLTACTQVAPVQATSRCGRAAQG